MYKTCTIYEEKKPFLYVGERIFILGKTISGHKIPITCITICGHRIPIIDYTRHLYIQQVAIDFLMVALVPAIHAV